MSELVPLGKVHGGSSVTHDGEVYAWEKDGAVIKVPPQLRDDLLAIRGADYFVPGEDTTEPESAEVTEPAPKAGAEVTEPAPARQPAHGRAAPKGGTARK